MINDPERQPNLSLSEDDGNEPGPSDKAANVKRGSRACDRCRKIKSKCEPGVGEKCKNCEVANTLCTFQGPSFKRGPPKGYIHSIEQRWHQVECILATIMESPRAQDIINDLRGDPFANGILNRVQAGPYGTRRASGQQPDIGHENFYASSVEGSDGHPAREDRRSRRQSRVSREIVSQDPTAMATPTKEWQEQLSRKLAYGNQWAYPNASMSPISRSSSGGGSKDPARTRRRLDYPGQPSALSHDPQNWDNLYTLPDASREGSAVDEAAETFGYLSVDENQEFRYHGSASGLPLLAQSRRMTGGGLQEDRIWKFSQADIDPEISSQDPTHEEEDVAVRLPSRDMQTHLLRLYFTYVHPFFPVVHKQDFLYHYNSYSERTHAVGKTHLSHHSIQEPCKILLLSMFAIAARYSNRPEDHPGQPGSNVSRAGQQYAEDAHRLLDRKYQTSRPSTCQALLLLAIREFGMGAMDKGWLYSGMALRMAIDLGMNRNADSWTTDGETPVFTDTEKQARKHIWWSCCICDKLSAVWLGRPITFRANDHSTPVPSADEVDETEMWEPYPRDSLGHNFVPQPSRLMSAFQEACHLSVIITDIMDKLYPVQQSSETPRRVLFEQLEARLTKWLIALPEHLRYSANDRHANPLPHILMLHIEYQAAVLLLHRAFLPAHTEGAPSTTHDDPLSSKAFDVCSGAAVHIASMATIYNERFGLEKAPPFLSIYLQCAGIMHVITLTRHASDPQAALGLSRCISACKCMEKLWPTATRLRMLLEGAKVRLGESGYVPDATQTGRAKRSVETALGSARNPDTTGANMYAIPPAELYPSPANTTRAWDYAQTIGVSAPGLDAHTPPFYPGYQWWPHQLMTTEGLTHMALSAPMEVPPISAPMVYGTMPGPSMAAHVQQAPHPPHGMALPHPQQHGQHGMPQEPFTFGQSHISQGFANGVQDVNYPAYDYRYSHPGHPGHDLPPRQ